jgi:hypothetical protein
LPDGLLHEFRVQPFQKKYFASSFGRNSFTDSRHPVPQEGRIMIVTDVGLRDAVDAAVSITNDACADGEAVWS